MLYFAKPVVFLKQISKFSVFSPTTVLWSFTKIILERYQVTRNKNKHITYIDINNGFFFFINVQVQNIHVISLDFRRSSYVKKTS
jgi:hypothetical protein